MVEKSELIAALQALVQECDEADSVDLAHVHGYALDRARELLKRLKDEAEPK